MRLARSLLGNWSLGISSPQRETGAAGTAHFEPGAVIFGTANMTPGRPVARWRFIAARRRPTATRTPGCERAFQHASLFCLTRAQSSSDRVVSSALNHVSSQEILSGPTRSLSVALFAGSEDGEDRRRFWKGLALFCAICSIGGMANLDVAAIAYRVSDSWALVGLAGVPIGALFNFAMSSNLIWWSQRRQSRRAVSGKMSGQSPLSRSAPVYGLMTAPPRSSRAGGHRRRSALAKIRHGRRSIHRGKSLGKRGNGAGNA